MAATIGVIVVAGISQMFANMAGQVKRMEDRSKRIFFNEFVGGVLRDGCEKTLEAFNDHIAKGENDQTTSQTAATNPIKFTEIKNKNGSVVLDLEKEKARLEAQYGIVGNNYFQLKCLGALSNGTHDDNCNCSGTTSACSHKWRLNLITQNKIKGVLVYERGIAFELDIDFPSGVSATPTTTQLNSLDCNNLLIAGQSNAGSGKLCNHTDCGSTPEDITDTTKESITAFGKNAGDTGVGQHNTFIGFNAGDETTNDGQQNTFIGSQAGKKNTGGDYNTFVGSQSGSETITGNQNTYLGYDAGGRNTASYNIFIGYKAGSGPINEQQAITGDQNTFIGTETGTNNITGRLNTFIGAYTGMVNKSGSENIFIGFETGNSNIHGGKNIFIGRQAGFFNTANENTFIGYYSGNKNTIGKYNTFVGYQAGKENIGDKTNTNNIKEGEDNTFVGYQAGLKNTYGNQNTFIGSLTGSENTTGGSNTFLGHKAGKETTTGGTNTFIGNSAGEKNTTAGQNTFIGDKAGLNTKTGGGNVFIGQRTGSHNTTGTKNTFIGSHVGDRAATSSHGNILIGSGVFGTKIPTDSNQFIVGTNYGLTQADKNKRKQFLRGTIGTDDFKVNQKPVCLSSANGKEINCPHTLKPSSTPTPTPIDELKINGAKVCLSNSGTATSCPTSFSDSISFTGGITANAITVGGSAVCLQNGTNCPAGSGSSKTLKKNIKPFKDFEGALQDIINTPLFTYEFKEDLPDKNRVGIISENLPAKLQIKEKNKASRPDWPSIYGTLWAGIKALNKKILKFEISILKKLSEIENRLISFIKQERKDWDLFQDQTKTALSQTKTELKETKTELKNTQKELAKALERIDKLEKKMDSKEQ